MSLETTVPTEQANFTPPPEQIQVSETLKLELLRPEHAHDLYGLIDQNREFLSPTMPYTRDYTFKDAQAEVIQAMHNIEDGKEAFYMIMHEDELGGTISLYNRQEDEASMGYYLAERTTGKGVATASAQALLDVGFNAWGLKTVVMRIRPDNEASQRLALRIGAVRQEEQVELPDNSGTLRTFDIWKVTKP